MGNKLGKNKVYVVSGSGGRDMVDGAQAGGGGSDMESEPDPDVNYSGPSPWSPLLLECGLLALDTFTPLSLKFYCLCIYHLYQTTMLPCM